MKNFIVPIDFSSDSLKGLDLAVLFSKKKDTAKHVLEVGIGHKTDENGGSIKLWKDYFINAKIFRI